MQIKRLTTITLMTVLAALTITFGTAAALNTTVVVSPGNEQGFITYAENGGAVTFVTDAEAPAGTGALRLTTNNTNEAYAEYLKETNTPLAQINQLSYYSKQNSGSPSYAGASFALGVDLDGSANGSTQGFTYLVYEPYLQTQAIVPGVFQYQDVVNGRLYSTGTVTCSNGTIQSGAGGTEPFYTLAQIQQTCPEAVVSIFGVFIGTYNANYDVEVDKLNFNGTTYDFEPSGGNPTAPGSLADCKNGGFRNFSNPSFKNQGQCIQYVNTRSTLRSSRR